MKPQQIDEQTSNTNKIDTGCRTCDFNLTFQQQQKNNKTKLQITTLSKRNTSTISNDNMI